MSAIKRYLCGELLYAWACVGTYELLVSVPRCERLALGCRIDVLRSSNADAPPSLMALARRAAGSLPLWCVGVDAVAIPLIDRLSSKGVTAPLWFELAFYAVGALCESRSGQELTRPVGRYHGTARQRADQPQLSHMTGLAAVIKYNCKASLPVFGEETE